ncbi:MAG: ribosome maturation factor RimM [Candidatus Sulfotelmatobacter sp.]
MIPGTSGEFITLARVKKTQGRRGEVAVEVHSDIPGRFAEGMKLFALPAAATAGRISGPTGGSENRRELQVEDLWPHKEWLVLKFHGVDSITDAEALVGSELQVPSSQRAELGAGWNYVSDLVGCTVLDHGREIGRIADVQFGAGEAPLLVVADSAGRKFDVPFAEAYLESVDNLGVGLGQVDLDRREVRMNLPPGMLEINASLTADEKEQQRRARRPDEGKKR